VPAWLVRRLIDRCRRKLRTDYLDVFHIFMVGDGGLSERMLEALRQAKAEGKIRAIAVSTHVRRYGAELAQAGKLDVLMMRYNAAHRGAEHEIFPLLGTTRPGVVSYTATCWRKLLKRPGQWPSSERIPSAGDCYRFVLGNPNVDVCLTAPRSARELEENLAAVARGPLSEEEMSAMRRFGDAVHERSRWF
jgi:aryl-alcohol dehydrogenase-like predicted oxidoreductase